MKPKKDRPAEKTINGEHKAMVPTFAQSVQQWNALIEEIKTRNARIKDAIKETDAS